MRDIYTSTHASPVEWYSLFRRLNRIFSDPYRAHLEEERETLDPMQMGQRERILLKNLLMLMGRYEHALNAYPLLRVLVHVPDVADPPIVLDDWPDLSYPWLTKRGIIL